MVHAPCPIGEAPPPLLRSDEALNGERRPTTEVVSLPPPCFFANQAEALFDGEAYDAMADLLGRAEHSIRLEFFLFGGPHADRMIDRMAQKRAEGVEVRVTLDRAQGRGLLPLVRRECRAAYRRLKALNIDVVLSDRRPFPNSPNKAPMAHNKFIVVDDREALVGGMNVGAIFFRHHDVMIKLTGPTAQRLGQQFDYDRQFVLHAELPRPEGSPPVPPFRGTQDAATPLAPGQSWVRLLGTGVGRRTTNQALLHNLRAARSSVCVALCEMGATDLLDELIAAERRGVDVRILLDPLSVEEYLPAWLGALRGRTPLSGILNASAVEKLLRCAGVALRLYRVGSDFCLMHLKMALFDGRSAIVGSTNWTRGGLEWVGETDVELHGGPVIEQLAAQFEQDWRRSQATPAGPPTRPARLLCRLYERCFQ